MNFMRALLLALLVGLILPSLGLSQPGSKDPAQAPAPEFQSYGNAIPLNTLDCMAQDFSADNLFAVADQLLVFESRVTSQFITHKECIEYDDFNRLAISQPYVEDCDIDRLTVEAKLAPITTAYSSPDLVQFLNSKKSVYKIVFNRGMSNAFLEWGDIKENDEHFTHLLVKHGFPKHFRPSRGRQKNAGRFTDQYDFNTGLVLWNDTKYRIFVRKDLQYYNPRRWGLATIDQFVVLGACRI